MIWVCMAALAVLVLGLEWKHRRAEDKMLDSIAKLLRAHREAEKLVTHVIENVAELNEKVRELPTEELKELANKEQEFQDGLRGMLDYGLRDAFEAAKERDNG